MKIYQQTNSENYHIGQVAELTPGAIDTAAPEYDKAAEKAKWDGTAFSSLSSVSNLTTNHFAKGRWYV